MKRNTLFMTFTGAALAILLCAGCATSAKGGPSSPLSPVQRAAMQTKELEGDADTGFAAALSVLQDYGWQIDAVDRQGGIIQASSLRREALLGPEDEWRANDKGYMKSLNKSVKDSVKRGIPYPMWTRWQRLTLTSEPWGKKSLRMRITVVDCGTMPSGAMAKGKKELIPIPGKEQTVVVDDPQLYKRLFQDIQKAIFVRQGLKGKAK
ncbi:MAG TPA: hypothetical protein PLI09_11935 [Candidatus Hydrogenedentes bacterium]|nr:hypothetical protein [Candidatus Hydrogenedentota bacterium]